MSAQQRYRTMIPLLTSLYMSEDSISRTNTLREGLMALTDCCEGEWPNIRKDADRLLRVWASKETGAAAAELMGQIQNVLGECADEAPRLIINEVESEGESVAISVIRHDPPQMTMSTPLTALAPMYRDIVESAAEDSDDEESEEVEEEEEEDEEEGMEVEKRRVRGRDYWFEEKTNKLYAVTADDDVGDEVGILMASGAPVFRNA